MKLYRVRDLNQATAGPAATRQQRRPFNAQFPEFSFINYLETSANSNYNALQTTIKQRLIGSGFNLFGTYTWSKSIDDASNGIYSGTRGVAYPQDSYNLRAERAVSSFDLRHRITVNVTYELNFLTQSAGRLAETTDRWLAAQRDLHRTERSADHAFPERRLQRHRRTERSARISSAIRTPVRALRTEWFNKAAFSQPVAGYLRQLGSQRDHRPESAHRRLVRE